jgi:hypothetical protein
LVLVTLLRRRRGTARIIVPGVLFSSWDIPRPLIPYDRIYEKRFKRMSSA